jgi:AbrB family looped-hinge helix DNA binding protein
MKTTIDKAGRVVIPAPVRERARLSPGTELEVRVDDFGVHLERAVEGPRLVRRGERWVAQPTVPRERLPKVDVDALIEEERNRWPL